MRTEISVGFRHTLGVHMHESADCLRNLFALSCYCCSQRRCKWPLRFPHDLPFPEFPILGKIGVAFTCQASLFGSEEFDLSSQDLELQLRIDFHIDTSAHRLRQR